MFVKEVLARKGNEVKKVDPEETIEVAAALMRLERIGALVVSGADGALDGVLSEKDVVRAIADCGARALRMKVADFMDRKPTICSAEDTVAKVARTMTLHRARHVPVMEQDRVAGLISIGDVVRDRFEEMELERDTLRDIALSHQLAG
ncbi:CBS domain-containing protein [Roseitranquillus sediminis]|uniref:CBS domain-containing protein n=1 Tax=Roseitranquillus sediminis TaxID=2809051 RepID=UPI001D0C40A3|nr:CBS domain-containing protein [Roseitranquillus sediminis]MBM9593984.1 CBS domain-containing protein [Roseitranquillus sediminis]